MNNLIQACKGSAISSGKCKTSSTNCKWFRIKLEAPMGRVAIKFLDRLWSNRWLKQLATNIKMKRRKGITLSKLPRVGIILQRGLQLIIMEKFALETHPSIRGSPCLSFCQIAFIFWFFWYDYLTHLWYLQLNLWWLIIGCYGFYFIWSLLGHCKNSYLKNLKFSFESFAGVPSIRLIVFCVSFSLFLSYVSLSHSCCHICHQHAKPPSTCIFTVLLLLVIGLLCYLLLDSYLLVLIPSLMLWLLCCWAILLLVQRKWFVWLSCVLSFWSLYGERNKRSFSDYFSFFTRFMELVLLLDKWLRFGVVTYVIIHFYVPLQKPGGIIPLLDEAWYAHSFTLNLLTFSFPGLKISCTFDQHVELLLMNS